MNMSLFCRRTSGAVFCVDDKRDVARTCTKSDGPVTQGGSVMAIAELLGFYYF